MAVPCRHCTDILRLLDSLVTVVRVAAIGKRILISIAAGPGLVEEIDTDSIFVQNKWFTWTTKVQTKGANRLSCETVTRAQSRPQNGRMTSKPNERSGKDKQAPVHINALNTKMGRGLQIGTE
ncbi:hypothetical protein CSKR_110628 [Clonorchis sinensis]|uniref:Uncharacterized protein n=1 Tax=Clonorchis sinensis TaxID=79923 RepID=A0A3R7CRY7_CLOSI|nr:hypothetical protein CSKR_110628 [Clonorchis sinensis]